MGLFFLLTTNYYYIQLYKFLETKSPHPSPPITVHYKAQAITPWHCNKRNMGGGVVTHLM